VPQAGPRGVGQGQRHLQGEGRARPFFGFRRAGAAHAFGQGAGDRQAQAGAAVTPGNRAVGLLEGDEHHFQAVAVDADARVAHAAGQPDHLLIEHLPAALRPPLRRVR
jgi:hypothetical protein